MLELITGIGISLASYHFDRDVKRNEVNPGVFVELQDDWVVGVYRNSHYRTTGLIARRFDFGQIGSVNVGGLVGACSGYDYPVCAALSLQAGPVELVLTPPVGQYSSGAVALIWRLK